MHIKNIKNKVQNSNMKNSLSFKLSMVFIGVACILVLVSLISVLLIIRKERREYAEREAENVLISLSTSIRSDIDSYRNFSRLIMTDQRVKDFLRADADRVDVPLMETAKQGVLEVLNVTTGVDSVFIFRNDLKFLSTINRLDYKLNYRRISQSEWKDSIFALKGRASLSLNGNGAIERTNGKTLLTINRAVYDNVTQLQTGYIFMNLSLSFLENEIGRLKNENTCIVMTDGTYLAGNKDFENYYNEVYAAEEILHKDISDFENRMILSSIKLKNLPIVILYAIEDNKRLLPMELVYIILLIPVVSCICVFAAVLFIKKNITTPIFALTSQMEIQKEAKGIQKIELELPKNEIGMMKESYNSMVDQTNLLLERLLEKEQIIQRAEMRVLHEQIKPHFLYNSLETIGFLAMDAGAEKVHSALETLGSFYRNFLSKGDREIPLKREIMIIKDYLSLQKLRYGDILNDEYDIAKDTEECYIPKLILQPLVENSIYHGIRLKGEPGTIKISSFLKSGELHILVRDTGVGMSQEQIESVLSTEKKETESEVNESFGLWGTIERIRCYCDKDDIVRISSEPGEYTEIEFIMPSKLGGGNYVQSNADR